ncbi:MAG: NTP transferase domain-containing protein, partial [Candidatus Heimdallarchaeota archaeon]|nr:NTP transferase domain-containing protein [Candidatus Heimdallarchaeota archaeon]MCK4255157.1 NTP transferase domain-containing protein [Candidatus Heimdallarchaeota archaeon]
MKAILLAAGEGLRLRPLTENVPKPLLKILDKTILERSINSLSKCGVESFVIITNYKEEKIIEYILDKFSSLDIVFVHQPEIKGTGNAFLLAKNHIQEEFFIGVNGDCLYSFSLIKQTVEAAKNNTVSVGGKLVSNPEDYGVILIDDNSVPHEIKEKPSQTEIKEGYANIGLYSLSKDIFPILEKIEEKGEISPRGEYELPDAINRVLSARKYPVNLITLGEKDYWFDIGRPWSLLEANKNLLDTIVDDQKGEIEDGVHIKGKIILKKGAIIRSGTYIEGPVFIDEEAVIGPNCHIRSHTYLGKKSKVGNACEIKNSIIGDNTHVAHLSYVGDTIIGENCNFGAGTKTANLRLDKQVIPVNVKGKREDSGRRKLGAIIGD